MATASTSSNPAIERCAGDPAAFVRDHWAKAPLLRRGAGPDGFDDLLSLDDVDRFLSTTSPRTPAFRMVADGKPLPPSAYTRSGRMGSAGGRYSVSTTRTSSTAPSNGSKSSAAASGRSPR